MVNLSTGQTTSVINDTRFPSRPPTISAQVGNLSWSPDGTYFAFHSLMSGSDEQETYLYDTNTHTLTKLNPTGVNQYQLSWSPDSAKIAVVSFTCDQVECSRIALDIYSAATAAIASSVDLSAFSAGPFDQATRFCDLEWSTNSSYISFVDQCDGSALGSPREVQVVDLMTSTIVQATTLTPTDVLPADSIFVAVMDTIWVDDQMLLIGLEAQEGELFGEIGALTPQTLAYNALTQSTALVAGRRLNNWTRANNSLFGFLAHTYPDNPQWGTLPESSAVEIASFDGPSFSVVVSAPPAAGCPGTAVIRYWRILSAIL